MLAMDFRQGKIYIGNIPSKMNQFQIKDYFLKFGDITKVDVKEGKTYPFKKYGFITYSEAQSALNCLKKAHKDNPYGIAVRDANNYNREDRKRRTFKEGKNDVHGKCTYCGGIAKFLCRCYGWYCSLQCQKAFWPQHYIDCLPALTVATNQDLLHMSLPYFYSEPKEEKIYEDYFESQNVEPKNYYPSSFISNKFRMEKKVQRERRNYLDGQLLINEGINPVLRGRNFLRN